MSVSHKPYGHQASMYIRPLLVGMHPQMQLVPYPEAIFAVMCAPVGSYYGEHLRSFAGVIPGNYDRAAPKGSGSYKIGAKTRQHTDHDKPYHKIFPKYTIYQICDAHAYEDRNHHRKPNLRDQI